MIVSSSLSYYQPLFPSLISFEDFSIIMNETDFFTDPVKSLNNVVRLLSNHDEHRLISGLALIQHMLIIDHPQSLFVSAFVHELSFSNNTYGIYIYKYT